MLDIFADTFSNCVWLAVLIVALIPTFESKIAIPFGMSTQIFGGSALNPVVACVVAMVGSLLPSALIIWGARKLKNRTAGFVSDKMFDFVNSKTKKYMEKFGQKATVLKKCIYLAGFVAIPMPLTGVYTGSLIAGLSSLKFWQGFLAIALGQVFACVGITVVCAVFENSAFYIFLLAMVFILLVLLANLAIFVFGKIRNRKRKTDQK